MRRPSLLMLAVLGIAVALPVAAQWKWKDAKGQVQYSDLPPPQGVTDKDILQRPAASQRREPMVSAATAPASGASAAVASAASPSAPRGTDPELEARRKKAEQDELARRKAEEQKVAAAKAENCQRARDYIRTLESGVRMSRVNTNGEREVFDDKVRAEEMKRARDIAANDCR